MPKRKIPTKNAAAVALARLSARSRFKTMTAAERSAQGRMAVAARRDRQPKGPWYGLVELPADYKKWKGIAHASKILDEAHANPQVILWSTDRAEVVARSKAEDLRNRTCLIIQQDWDPKTLTVRRVFQPDAGAQVRALRAILDDKGGA